MSWSEIVGHRDVIERFSTAVTRGRLASSFLFSGPPGIGKHTVALEWAKALLCETMNATHVEACGQCLGCIQVAARTHPDLVLVSRPADKNQIPVEKFIGPEDHRMQEGLCFDLGLKPFRGGRKVAVIDDADYLNAEGANCLLKTLEEPPPKSVLILVGTSPQKQLPTIRSRCQWVRFAPLSRQEIATILLRKNLAEDTSQAEQMAALSGGSVARALMMRDEQVVQFRTAWLEQLASADPGKQLFAKSFNAFIEAAGADAAVRRDRMRLICDMALEFYHGVLQRSALSAESEEPVLRAAVNQAADASGLSDESVARCLERCLSAAHEISANANTALWVESLLIDLGRLGRGEVTAFDFAY